MSTGTIFDIKKFAIHDGPGVRTTVFFKGCPLGCWLCHNPESQAFDSELMLRDSRCDRCGDCVEVCGPAALSLDAQNLQIDRSRCDLCGACVDACLLGALEIAGREVTADEVLAEIEKDTVYYDESGGGVTISGGEPLSQADFLCDLLAACRARGIRTALDTCGHAPPAVFRRVARHVDVFLFDLKLIDDERHREFTGSSNEVIHENLRWLSEQGSDVVIRFPLLPGINDDDENIGRLGEFLLSLPKRFPVDVLPYHRMGVDKYARLGRVHPIPDLPPPRADAVQGVAWRLREFGLRVTVKGEEI
ncbi:MAG: glycyl-radical enzyme activating protein [Gemmatimonadales bacterium]|jgi:pyruvate formate lyase activating enzyme